MLVLDEKAADPRLYGVQKARRCLAASYLLRGLPT
jgi:hypothetical protein